MARFSPFRWFRNISIKRKLYFVVGVMALLIALELFTVWFSITTLSSVRAMVAGEGLWSKAQKDAIHNLQKYGVSGMEADYESYLQQLKIQQGDTKTRLELSKKNPDLDIARQGFLEGGNHPDDIDGMIKLLRRFNKISYISKAIAIWTEADSTMVELQAVAENLHEEIQGNGLNRSDSIDSYLRQITAINKDLTILENEFSATLGAGSRWLENLILKLMLAIALTVEMSGLIMTITVSRNISRDINSIVSTSQEVARGNFESKAEIRSRDEIGKLAKAFNEMTDNLAGKISELKRQEEITRLSKDELARSNRELEQFAYIASHDMQEPLRTVSNFVELIQAEYRGKMDANCDRYLHHIQVATTRMQRLVKDMLDYSRIGQDRTLEVLDFNLLVQEVLADLSAAVSETDAAVTVQGMPKALAYPDIKAVFLNLISNGIKFRDPSRRPEIHVVATEEPNEWLFEVKDNGIGIEKAFHERIFIIFKRLHSREAYEGTGIGLAHCAKIVDLHGGRIWVESQPEKGSTFSFTLPKKPKNITV